MSTQILCVLSVPVAAQAVATAEAKGKVKGATVTCPNRYIDVIVWRGKHFGDVFTLP